MIAKFSEFIENLVGARFSLKYLWELIVSLYDSIAQNEDILTVWTKIKGLLSPVSAFVPYIIIALGLAIAFFGKKMGGFLKFAGFFVVGFALGVHFLAPVIPAEVPIPSWVIGAVVAIVAAVLSKFLFIGAYSVTVLYSVYHICYQGSFLGKQVPFSAGKAITSLAVAAIVLVLTLIFFKFVEMLLFSAFGAWLVSAGFAIGIVDLGAIPKLSANSWILEISIIGVITLVSFIFQIKTRRRY